MTDQRTEQPAADPVQRFARAAGPLILIAATIAMLWWTWFKWPDPVVDFGRELYTAWQLSEGKVLYRDIAYFNGPLSPYFNALVFRVLGVGLQWVVLANFIILVAILVMVWRLWTLIADHLAALLACLTLVGVFAFIQLGGIGNYNFMAPYSHELTHGIALSLAAMLCLANYMRRPRDVTVAGAGLVVGLIFLTKPEVFVAAGTAVGVGVIAVLWSARASPRRAMRSLAQFALSALVPPLIALLLLLAAMPWGTALRGVAGAWAYVFDGRVSGMQFYRKVFGTLDAGNNVASMFESFIWWSALFGAVAAVAIALRRSKPTAQPWAFVGALVVSAVGMLLLYRAIDLDTWKAAFRGLALVVLVTTIALLILIARRDRSDEPHHRLVMQFVVACFALLMLGKMLLNVLLFHYGFALAMPATLVTVALLASWWPNFIDRRGGSGAILRGAAVAAVGLVIFVHLRVYGEYFSEAPVVVAPGTPDAFRSGDRRANSVNLMLDALRQLPSHATLATVPEGTMINYLSRRRYPTRYANLMPPEVIMWGQQRILDELRASPPDYVVVVRGSNPADYGYKSFAADYGRDIFAWIMANYREVPARTDPAYPLMLLERKQ